MPEAPDNFDYKEWDRKYGEGCEDLDAVFDYGHAVLYYYPYAETRLDDVLYEDQFEPDRVKELIISLFEQCENGLFFGLDPSPERIHAAKRQDTRTAEKARLYDQDLDEPYSVQELKFIALGNMILSLGYRARRVGRSLVLNYASIWQ